MVGFLLWFSVALLLSSSSVSGLDIESALRVRDALKRVGINDNRIPYVLECICKVTDLPSPRAEHLPALAFSPTLLASEWSHWYPECTSSKAVAAVAVFLAESGRPLRTDPLQATMQAFATDLARAHSNLKYCADLVDHGRLKLDRLVYVKPATFTVPAPTPAPAPLPTPTPVEEESAATPEPPPPPPPPPTPLCWKTSHFDEGEWCPSLDAISTVDCERLCSLVSDSVYRCACSPIF